MNSNNQSDDEDMFFVSKIQAQKVEIEALQKQLRLQEFQAKQQTAELTNELERERKRVTELEDQVNRQITLIGRPEVQAFALELEQKLANAENLILELRENEIKLHREVQGLRRKGDSQEVEELKEQLQKMEESAIGIIVEKEKIIQDLKDTIEDLKVQTVDPPIDMTEKELQIAQLKELIQELNQKMEQEQLAFDERLIRLEHEVTERILDSLHHEITESKSVEQDLLQQIQLQEEKIKHLEKILSDQDRLIENLKSEHKKESLQLETRLQEVQRRLSASLQQVLKSDKKSEEAFKHLAAIQRDRSNQANSREELMKQSVKLENHIRKLNGDIADLNQLIKNQQQVIEDLESQLAQQEEGMKEMQRDYEQQVAILKQQHHEQPCHDELQGQGGNLLSELLSEGVSNEANQSAEIRASESNPPETPKSKSGQGSAYFSSQKRSTAKWRNQDADLLKEEVAQQNRLIDNLKTDIENYEYTIEVLQKEIKSQLVEIQNLRKNRLDYTGERDLRHENETLKQSLHKLETHYLTQKLSVAEEVSFLKDELKRAEKESRDAKILHSQAISEKEYFQSKLRKLENKANQKAGTATLQVLSPTTDSVQKKKGLLSYFK